jgi:hypothetical protein
LDYWGRTSAVRKGAGGVGKWIDAATGEDGGCSTSSRSASADRLGDVLDEAEAQAIGTDRLT